MINEVNANGVAAPCSRPTSSIEAERRERSVIQAMQAPIRRPSRGGATAAAAVVVAITILLGTGLLSPYGYGYYIVRRRR